ncbi:MAG: PAS domain S-box protein [Myxococcales bacterium]|nr:PAS domain S-box protein [Myxococcales bacterium]
MASFDPAQVLEQLLAHITATVEIADPQGRILHVNRRFTEVFGYTLEEARGHTPAELLRSDLHDPAFYEAMWSTIMDRRVWHGELVSRAKDGSVHHSVATVLPNLDPDGTIVSLMAIKEPLTPLDEAAEGSETHASAMTRLRASEQRYRAMVGAAGDAIMVADFDTALFVDANRAAREMFGYEVAELRRLTTRMLTAPEDHAALDRIAHDLVHEGGADSSRLRMRRKDGSPFWAALRMATYELAGQRLYVVILRDVSEQVTREAELAESNERLRAAQERLRQSERLAALGQLSAAVAHEINNPLQFIDASLSELRRTLRGLDVPPDARTMLDELRDAIDRIANITRDLASFTRIETEKVERIDLDEVVRQSCRIIKNELRHRARLELQLAAPRTLPAERGKLIQLVTNLLLNAAHAIVEGQANANVVRVETRQTDQATLLSVEDSGSGIPPELLERVFEPFFTTKPTGHGSGLGLPVCAEIVRLHGGTIDVRSEPGRGSRFEIQLPFDNGLLPPAAEAAPPPKSSRRRILLIDDDTLVLRGMRRLLASQHDVVTAQGGSQGLEVLETDQRFDVILCDLMMPTVDGIAIHAAVRRNAPHLANRIVFCSGGAFTPRTQKFVASITNPLLKKPVRADALFEAIDRVTSDAAKDPSGPR